MSEEIIELKNKVAELEAQVRVMRGIIVQAMLQNNREQPVETGYAKNPGVYTTSTSVPYGQYGSTAGYAAAMGQNMSQALEDAIKPLTAFSKFTEPQA